MAQGLANCIDNPERVWVIKSLNGVVQLSWGAWMDRDAAIQFLKGRFDGAHYGVDYLNLHPLVVE